MELRVGDRVQAESQGHWSTVLGTIVALTDEIQNGQQVALVQLDKDAKYADGNLVMESYRQKPIKLYRSSLVFKSREVDKETYYKIDSFGIF